jgi:CBS domain containing-hemolysin-like protein
MAIVVPIVIISILIGLNAIFVAAEFAIVAAPRTRITQLAEEGNNAAQTTLKVLLEPVLQNRYIATAQVGITVVSVALGAYGEHIVAEWILHALGGLGFIGEALAHTLATVLAVGLLTYLHVVLGEMIPKSVAIASAEKTVLWLAAWMHFFGIVSFPFVWLLNLVGDAIVRLLGVPPAAGDDRLFTPEELEFIVEESLEGGMIDPSEQLFIENIFDLPLRTVEQVMTPRTQVRGIPVDAGESLIHRLICETRKSRYPIYETDLDQIVGILHIKDFARRIQNPEGALDLRALARPAVFVPENLTLDRMLLRFQQENIQLAIAIDEFGGMAGVVSLEDLVEEVVGEIQDEFDREILPIEELAPGILRVRGDLILDELDQLYEIEFSETEAYTVGGLVMELLGRIPRTHDVTRYNGIEFEVESTDRLAVQSVIVRLPSPAPGDEPPPEG